LLTGCKFRGKDWVQLFTTQSAGTENLDHAS